MSYELANTLPSVCCVNPCHISRSHFLCNACDAIGVDAAAESGNGNELKGNAAETKSEDIDGCKTELKGSGSESELKGIDTEHKGLGACERD